MGLGEEVPRSPIAGQENSGQEKILVSVRVRPLNEKELSRNDLSEWECINENTIIYRSNYLSASERSMYPAAYTYDRAFSSDCSTRQVYEEGAKEVALSVVKGINSSVFAYGQTSSGKTYTMSGITEHAVADIYDYIEKHKEREFVLKFSAMEIYNESVRDLLGSDATPLRLLDDPERGTVVERLTEEIVEDRNHFRELLAICAAQRQIGETSLNETSSRSHQILRLTIESSAHEFLGNDKSSSLAATVNFVDLAGSERASQTLSAGTRLKEGCHINRSLLTLGSVVRKLSKGKNGHIPFRDSKLTRILQSSLGGNAKTAIICTMSPARSHVEQSRNTLLFATCAKQVSTNAQVNVVMSDKALVKQLQREVARLENELKISGNSDTSALLREKDSQVDKLEKQVKELTLQRDLAQCQIKDLLRVVGDDMPSMELASLDLQYPKLRVRSSWDMDNQTYEAQDIRSFDPSQYSDGHSRSSSDDNLIHIPDVEENLLHIRISPRISISDIDGFESGILERKVEHNETEEFSVEENDENIEDIFQELEAKKYARSNVSDLSPNGYTGSNMSSPGSETRSSRAIVIENGRDKENQDLDLLVSDREKQPSNFRRVYISPCPEKTSSGLWEDNSSSSRGLMLTKSRSCKASLMTNPYSDWFEKAEKIDNAPPFGFEEEYTGQPESSFQRKLSAMKFNDDTEMLSKSGSKNSAHSAANKTLSRNGSKNSVHSAVSDENDVHKFESSIEKEGDGNGNSTLVTAAKEKEDLESESECENEYDLKTQSAVGVTTSISAMKEKEDNENENELRDQSVMECRPKCMTVTKSVKDVGLDPMPSDIGGESPTRWNLEFQRLQREIIELWHACNISLVHRTYFFLLFKGEPADSIYMEVEFRRLSFLKNTFSQGSHTLEDGRSLTPASSMKSLRKERQMLSRQMQKKLSRAERENLYMKWGIGSSTRHRRLQLAHRLWSDTKDMNHIRESAMIVAKLTGSVEPDHAFKEMFGLNFAPKGRGKTRKSFAWKGSVKHLL